ncbi:acyltransferase family protein [Ralstonia wenshanensis]|uniref:acyltransferase family protein n=1 Tax=Ralstonia wenshanensis TaxID=2842456 RepID=UPI003D99B289
MNGTQKFAYIDAMRGIAILMVIAVHCGQYVRGAGLIAKITDYCQMGVQLFFVASALTLCLSAVARREESRPLLKFYIRRFFRIAPAYYVGIAFYTLWTISVSEYQVGPYPNPDNYTPINILANALFLHGLYPPANNTIVPGGWSIAAEMLFYAFFPFLFRAMERMKNRHYAALAAIGAGAAVVPLIHAATGLPVFNGSFLYFSIAVQISVFIIGMVYFWETQSGRALKHPSLCFAIFLAVAIALWETGQVTLMPAFFAVSFVCLAESLRAAPMALLRWLRPIGKFSFSMYLCHFAVFNSLSYLINRKIGLQATIGTNTTLLVFYLTTVAITFVIASCMYRMVERPMIALGAKIVDRMDKPASNASVSAT